MGKRTTMDRKIFRFLVSSLLVLHPWQTFGIGDTHLCSTPLGMESKEIPDLAISASSFYVNSIGAQYARLNTEAGGGSWCPKEPIAHGVREYLEVDFNRTMLVTGIQIQGRYAKGRGQEYTEEFEVEYWRRNFGEDWRKYIRFDGKTVLPGNSDTLSIVMNKLRPPLIARRIRILPFSNHRRTVCLRLEFLGCPFEGGLVQYSMRQGDMFSEGIYLRDETYDGEGGKWSSNRKVSSENSNPSNGFEQENIVNIFNLPNNPAPLSQEEQSQNGNLTFPQSLGKKEEELEESSFSLLSGGLGQLTDTIEGTNSFSMDIGYGLGTGWVGWRRRRRNEVEEFVEIIFEFENLRKFKSMDIYSANNFPNKGVQIFSRARVYLSHGGVHYSRDRAFTHLISGSELNSETSRNLTIQLEGRTGRFLRLHLYFRAEWIVIGEIYFSSEIYEDVGENSELEGPLDFLESQSVEIGELDSAGSTSKSSSNSSSVETIVGIISGLVLLFGTVVGLTIWMKTSGRSIPSTFRDFHSSFWRPSWSYSHPTHIVTQPNPVNEGVKDLLLTLTPNGHQNHAVNGNGINTNTTTLVMNGNHKGPPPPPPYTSNGTLSSNQTNGLKGPHYNNYGSTTIKYKNGNSPAINGDQNIQNISNPADLYPQQQFTIRANQLAQFDQPAEPEYEETLENNLNLNIGVGSFSQMEGIYKDASIHSSGGGNNDTLGGGTSCGRNRKNKMANSVWSLHNIGGRSFRHRSRLVPEVTLRQLRLIENLGVCLYGQVHLYDFEGEINCHEGNYTNCRLLGKTIKNLSEIRLLSVLDHENVLAMIGVCGEMKNLIALFPTPECGDLCSFLSGLSSTPSLSWLLNAATQVSSGMNYLESLSIIHRDLSARNCLVEREGSIKISDFAIACEQYRGDYSYTSNGIQPLRWWPWDSILSNEFTNQSCAVWSFGVVLWEILTLCRQRPLAHISDRQLTTLAEKYGSKATIQSWLPQPLLSPPEIYELMCQCWGVHEDERPSFQIIHLFLEQKFHSSTIYHAV